MCIWEKLRWIHCHANREVTCQQIYVYVYGIVSVLVLMALQGWVPDTLRWIVRCSREQGENVTNVTCDANIVTNQFPPGT